MASNDSEQNAGPIPSAIKILVAGGFGAGKTTLVGTLSEIPPLSTEEHMTEASLGVDDLEGVEQKTTTTVALDFGRITISDDIVLYMFGTPGRTASGSCGRSSSQGRWARSSWPTPGAWRRASRPWTSSSGITCRSSSR